MNKAHEAFKQIGEIMFFHHEGYSTNIRSTEEFKVVEKYIDQQDSKVEELEKAVKYYQALPVKLSNELNKYKNLLDKTISALVYASENGACPNFISFNCEGIKCDDCKFNEMTTESWDEWLKDEIQEVD